MSTGQARRGGRVTRVSFRVLIAVAGLLVATACFPPPPATLPQTVSADALPTVQINGVVWSQVTVGNTVFATGQFTRARPAGAAPGVNEVGRGNILAYDIRTGALTGFSHFMNAPGRFITTTPDQTKVIVGGDFTQVDGQWHRGLAEFNARTGQLISGFTASVRGGPVRAITATNTIVYAGGGFAQAGGPLGTQANRGRLAAFLGTTGQLLGWAPTANDEVLAMLLTPNQQKVIVGGQFTQLNGINASGIGALNWLNGGPVAWNAGRTVHDSGANSGINSLRTDGFRIYATGFKFGAGPGNLEGAFATDVDNGTINWIEDCHGDTYDSLPQGNVLYAVGHAHFCGNIQGGFPESTPRSYYHATAFTNYPTGHIAHNTLPSYSDWYGWASPTLLNWFPTLTTGTFTGQMQAAWSLTGNGQFIALGGEFPTVNSRPQQGLVRFAVRSIAPNKVGPRPRPALDPTISSAGGKVTVTWGSTFDQDDSTLTYKAYKYALPNGALTLVCSVNSAGRQWQAFPISCTDSTGTKSGTTYRYRVLVFDPWNNFTNGNWVNWTAP